MQHEIARRRKAGLIRKKCAALEPGAIYCSAEANGLDHWKTSAKHIAEAFAYLDYMSVEGIKVWFANIPDMPANKQVSTDLVPQLTAQKRGEAFAKDITAFFRKQLDVATPMWTSPIQDFSNDQLNRAIDQILHKTASPKDALAEAQKASQAKLEETLKA